MGDETNKCKTIFMTPFVCYYSRLRSIIIRENPRGIPRPGGAGGEPEDLIQPCWHFRREKDPIRAAGRKLLSLAGG